MNPSGDTYKKKVWDFLDKMRPGDRYKVAEICEADNREKFITCIKAWMDVWPYQGGLNFNHNYTEFYMIHIPEEALKLNKKQNIKTP